MRSIFLSLFCLLLSLTACGEPERASLTTDTRGGELATEAESVAFLGRYLTLKSEVEATEFHIVYHDNSGGLVPGPSDWEIEAVLQVPPGALPFWSEGLTEQAEADDLAWGYALATQRPVWQISSKPRVYEGQGMVVALFEPERIIFVRATTLE